MDCGQARRLMAAHLAGSDIPDEWQALRHHLRSCPACRGEAAAFLSTWDALAALPELEVPGAAWGRIQATLPTPQVRQAHQTPWLAPATTAAVAVLVSIAASLLLPYERAVRLCSDGLSRLVSPAGLPDPAAFFVVGFLYGLLPLGLVALCAARRLAGAGGYPGLSAGLAFGTLALPYVLIACGGLPAISTAALLSGILAGALAGGPAGLWAGGKFLSPAPA